jgi:NRPS condensation-like uncharacterized protein
MTNRPLPLTPMEEFWFWEDRPAYPASCFNRLHFDGELNRAAFESATDVAIRRHPLLRSIVERTGRFGLKWIPLENPEVSIQWSKGTSAAPFPPASRQDLTKEIGVRFYIRENGPSTDAVLQLHHACMDAMGMFSFLNDLLISYTKEVDGSDGDLNLPPIDINRLNGRGSFGITPGRFLRLLPKLGLVLQGIKAFLFTSPAPLIPHKAHPYNDCLPEGYPRIISQEFDEERSQRIVETAAGEDVTVNDLLVRDLFLALWGWQKEQGSHDPSNWLRLIVPMNMRQPGDDIMPAVNRISMVFPQRRYKNFQNQSHLLRGIHGEMGLIKQSQLGLTFNVSLQICRWVPGGLRKRVREDICRVSCAFTNLGNVLSRSPLPRHDGCIVAGNVMLKSMEIAIPLRPYTCASFTVYWCANRLSICLHYDPRVLSKNQATGLHNWYVKRIEESSRNTTYRRF